MIRYINKKNECEYKEWWDAILDTKEWCLMMILFDMEEVSTTRSQVSETKPLKIIHKCLSPFYFKFYLKYEIFDDYHGIMLYKRDF